MMTTAPKAPIALAQAMDKGIASPGWGRRQLTPREPPPRPVAEQAGLLLKPRLDASEGRLRAEYVVGRRLVDLRDDQGEEGVGRGLVQVSEQAADRRGRADEEPQQQAADHAGG